MTIIRKHAHEVHAATRKQTAHGTPAGTPAEVNLKMFLNSPAIPVFTPMRNPRSIAGQEFPEDVDDMQVASSVALDAPLAKHSAGVILPLFFGVATASGSGPYLQTLKHIATNELPVTSMIFPGGSTKGFHGSDMMLYDLAVEDFTVGGSGNGEAQIDLNANLVGSGRKTEDVSFTESGSTTVIDPLCKMGGLTFALGTLASEVDISSRIADWKLTGKNNIENGYKPGGGLYRTIAELGVARTWTLNFKVEADGTDDLFDFLNADLGAITPGSLLSCIITCTDNGGADFTKFIIPQLVFKNLTVEVGNKGFVNVETEILFSASRSTGYTSGNNGPVTCVLSNAADYATAPLTAFS